MSGADTLKSDGGVPVRSSVKKKEREAMSATRMAREAQEKKINFSV